MELDKYQRKVVYSKEKNILVIASAGSGKTRVLTERIRHLIVDNNVDPKNIITITFTNQAASEMKSRLEDVPGIEDAFVGTIHSFAYKALKSYDRSVKILNDELSMQLHNELISKYCKVLTRDKYLKFKQAEIQYRLRLISEDEFTEFLSIAEKRELNQIERGPENFQYPESINSICRTRNIITFDELIKLATQYLRDNNLFSEYVFVDEFQDIGTLEYKFILSLNANNYFFVGDDWQSIYSFKGGNVGIFETVYHDPSYKNYFLTTNYRSKNEIIEYCSKIMKKVTNKFNKEVEGVSSEKGFVVTTTQKYLDKCLSYIKSHGSYEDWFILTRTNAEIFEISQILTKHKIPFSVFKRDGATNSDIQRMMKEGSVKIMTVHSSKGLENKNVLLYGRFSLDKKLYSGKSDPSYKHKLFRYEEEFKVFYVGASRAHTGLIVIDTDPKNQNARSTNLKQLDK